MFWSAFGKLWRGYETVNRPIDFVFGFLSPVPFALPFGLGAVFLCSVFFESTSGIAGIGSFILGYAVGGIWQLALLFLLRKP